MCCTSIRRVLAVTAIAALALLLAGPWGAAQLGGVGGPGGKGGGKRGKGGIGGFGVGPGGAAVVLPEGLNHVPYDAAAFVHIRVADSLNGPASQALLKQLRGDGEQGKFVAQVEKRLGVRLADVDTITLFMLDLPALTARSALTRALGQPAAGADAEELPSVLVILTYSNPIDRKAVLRALAAAGESSLWPKVSAVFLNDRSVLFGTGPDLLKYTTGTRAAVSSFDDGTGGWGGGGTVRGRAALSAALAAGAEPHLIVAGAQVSAVARARLRTALRNGNIGPYGALLPLLNATAAITVDLRDTAEINVRFLAGSDQLALGAAQSLPTLAEMALDGKMPADSPFALSPAMHKAVRKAIAAASIAPIGKTANVEMRLSLEASPDELARLVAQAVVRLR